MKKFSILLLVSVFGFCQNVSKIKNDQKMNSMEQKTNEVAILANGCFWCTEAIFQQLKGVEKVEPGYIGGTTENPTYEQVCTGKTNHAEALRIYFDSSVLSYDELLEVFFATHDPTTLNRQGGDIGTQYRSEIFYTTANQKQVAEFFVKELNEENLFDKPVVTKVSEAVKFWVAEDYHKNYYENNKEKAYCNAVISPKVSKFQKYFAEKLK